MRKILLFSLLNLLLVVSVNADVIGYEPFDYANGPINGKTGGVGWDYNWWFGTYTGSVSAWVHQAGITNVTDGKLVLQDTGAGWISAVRQFEADEWTGTVQASGAVYFASTLTIDADQNWLGIDAAEGTSERVRFGMPWQGGILGFLAIRNENSGDLSLSSVQAVVGETYRIVGVVDFDNNAARMWIDPDASDHDTAWDNTSADVLFNDLGMTNNISGVRLSSDKQTTWDDLVVTTTFK